MSLSTPATAAASTISSLPIYTPEVADATAPVFDRLRDVIPEVEWPVHAPYVHAIRQLKEERDAVILAHNYMTPQIFHGVADLSGDSLALARMATESRRRTSSCCAASTSWPRPRRS